MKLLLLVLLLLVAIPAFTQQDSVKITTPGDTVVVTETWTVRQLKQFARQQRRDSIRDRALFHSFFVNSGLFACCAR